MDINTVLWLWLSMIFPAKSTRLYELYCRFGNSQRIFYEIKSGRIHNLLPEESTLIYSKSVQEQADNIANYCLHNGIEIITIENQNYPTRLLNISVPPLVLFCKGDTACLNIPRATAVVGARKACDYSLMCTERYSHYLAENNTVIISGFAKGVDSAAHIGAIKSGGKTIAVLGSGIMYDYPKNTMYFKEKIAENGAVISEYPPLAEPRPENFKIRNRIVAGLSDNILITEAGRKSGSINTASHGLEQGKDIFVIPPRDIFDKRFEGQILLLKDGACPTYSPNDLLTRI